MTAGELIERADIRQVWAALGGSSLQHGRGRAFWRNGDGWNVSLDNSKNAWFDHRDGRGGGILRLAEIVLGCDKGEALRWLADYLGVELDDRPPTRAERRQWAERRRRAEKLSDWHRRIVDALRARRNALWNSEHRVSAWARKHLNDPAMASDWRWGRVWKHALDNQQGDLVECLLELFETAPAETLVRLRANPALADVAAASLAELNVLRTVLEG